jgi:OmpR-family two-component system manganese-sensing response regulator
LQHLWQNEEQPNSNVIAALIRLLRRKVEGVDETPMIHTVYGRGYRFGSAEVVVCQPENDGGREVGGGER